ncbi:hypothetical protein MNBD_ALPHA11-1351 [hydrothermal vent metagenome]|uniref:Uncharacterized protein n=1 Tax=hydrothermal vent metagenome TaxID=652676 RepID=A0A3B0T502_9ZZZZ
MELNCSCKLQNYSGLPEFRRAFLFNWPNSPASILSFNFFFALVIGQNYVPFGFFHGVSAT